MDPAEELTSKIMAGLDDLHRSHLRHREEAMHRCALDCCTDDSLSYMEMNTCINKCNQEFEYERNITIKEFDRFENKLNDCITQCYYDMPGYDKKAISEKQVSKFEKQYNECRKNCLNTMIKLLPDVFTRIKNKLDYKNK